MSIKIIPLVYNKKNKLTDYRYLATHATESLLIFNDNEESFCRQLKKPGGGNACVRHLRGTISAGIPTGRKGRGYVTLDDKTKSIIDKSMKIIQDMLKTGKYKTVYYCATSEKDSTIGVAIYKVAPEVRKYITKCIQGLGKE